VKATKKNAQSMDALSSELLDVKLVTVSDGSKDVTILLLAENDRGLKVIAKLDVLGRSWVLVRQVMQALAMKNIGAATSVSKSKPVRRWVRLLHVSTRLVYNLKHQKRWVTYDLSR
jgi:hypothetical protein